LLSPQGRSHSPRERPNCADRWTQWPGEWVAGPRHPRRRTRSAANREPSSLADEGGGSRPPKYACSTIGWTQAARCSSQLKAQDAFRPPSAVGSSPVSVSCPVSSNKLVFISVRTWRAMGARSRTAFSKWASLSFRLAEPPCVPSRRSSKW